ncbi:preprotein translocase subunit SecG [Candidatus Thermokryptus mobilis]|uniref:Protein-export membrane protein SecG n=1 Tax=Candidatus Thermokryptus mobilis TaxID=1643428 RepID=A0A0S4MNY8_9BACT|nr:preprotein translocase subunit SecG [Candidatus Thermokryptus mobilis]CUU00505.1 preprotein translocase subunit SecG [Candidatus Thermokryptus mobilis]
MYSVLVAIEIIIAVLLIIFVLLQAGRGGGLAGAFGGAGFGTVFGIRRTADFLSKATITLGAIFLLLAIIINLFFLPGKTPESVRESIIQQRAKTVPPVTVPQPTQSQPAATPQEQK